MQFTQGEKSLVGSLTSGSGESSQPVLDVITQASAKEAVFPVRWWFLVSSTQLALLQSCPVLQWCAIKWTASCMMPFLPMTIGKHDVHFEWTLDSMIFHLSQAFPDQLLSRRSHIECFSHVSKRQLQSLVQLHIGCIKFAAPGLRHLKDLSQPSRNQRFIFLNASLARRPLQDHSTPAPKHEHCHKHCHQHDTKSDVAVFCHLNLIFCKALICFTASKVWHHAQYKPPEPPSNVILHASLDVILLAAFDMARGEVILKNFQGPRHEDILMNLQGLFGLQGLYVLLIRLLVLILRNVVILDDLCLSLLHLSCSLLRHRLPANSNLAESFVSPSAICRSEDIHRSFPFSCCSLSFITRISKLTRLSTTVLLTPSRW